MYSQFQVFLLIQNIKKNDYHMLTLQVVIMEINEMSQFNSPQGLQGETVI